MQLEEFGFCGRGEARTSSPTGDRVGGGLPINTHGGQLGEAYIHGMNGIAEGVRQIAGTSVNPVPTSSTCSSPLAPVFRPAASRIVRRSGRLIYDSVPSITDREGNQHEPRRRNRHRQSRRLSSMGCRGSSIARLRAEAPVFHHRKVEPEQPATVSGSSPVTPTSSSATGSGRRFSSQRKGTILTEARPDLEVAA